MKKRFVDDPLAVLLRATRSAIVFPRKDGEGIRFFKCHIVRVIEVQHIRAIDSLLEDEESAAQNIPT